MILCGTVQCGGEPSIALLSSPPPVCGSSSKEQWILTMPAPTPSGSQPQACLTMLSDSPRMEGGGSSFLHLAAWAPQGEDSQMGQDRMAAQATDGAGDHLEKHPCHSPGTACNNDPCLTFSVGVTPHPRQEVFLATSLSCCLTLSLDLGVRRAENWVRSPWCCSKHHCVKVPKAAGPHRRPACPFTHPPAGTGAPG